MKQSFFIAAAVFSLLSSACADAPAQATDPSHRLRVVSTFSVLANLVVRVGGDRIEPVVLVGADGDTHTYEPTPRDAVSLARADLIFENGLGLENWLDKLYLASGSQAKRVVVTRGITPRKRVESGREELDPHAWHDVKNAELMVGEITAALSRADPAGAGQFQSNADACLKQLRELDAWVVDQTQSIPPGRRKLVTSHDTFGYFADRYGFELIGAGLSSVTTESADPSAREIAELIREIRSAGVPAIFAENIQNPRLMEQVAREAKVRIVATLYTDALGPPGSAGETYIKMIRYNVQTIAGALRP